LIEDRRKYRNEDLILKVSSNVDPAVWDETKYESFLDTLCGHRIYQKDAIRTALSYLIGGAYENQRGLAKENFELNDELKSFYGRWQNFEAALQLPDQLACTIDLATGTGKSFVLYGIAMIMLAEGIVDRVLVLCPSNTIESGLLEKFKMLATDPALRDALPQDAKIVAPKTINASESIVEGALCVENYHAILETVKSSIRDLKGKGERTLILNDEAHHVANESGASAKKWKEFLLNEDFKFRFIVGVSATCYVGNSYFPDVVFRYSLRQAIEEKFVKRVEYIAEMPVTGSPEEKWQLVFNRHADWRKKLKSRNIRPLTIVVTQKIHACTELAEDLVGWISAWEGIPLAEAEKKVLAVSSAKEHQTSVARLSAVDRPESPVEWVVSVSMLSEGWDVKNVFQIVPHEERAFNSKLLIAQVLGRGLRRPDGWQGEEPIVTVFNHDSWSGRIRALVNEILEIERRVSARVMPESKYNFVVHHLDYTRVPEVSESEKMGEYNLLEKGFVDLPSQVESEDVTIEFERAVSGEHVKFKTSVRHKTFTVEEVAEQIYQRLKGIDAESADATDPNDRTAYSTRFTRERCGEIIEASLLRAGITTGRITDDNRQKFLQALGTLRRKATRKVVYVLSPLSLRELSTSTRQADSCSAAELRRASKTVFYSPDSESTLADDQREFFRELIDPDGEFVGACVAVGNSADFKTPTTIAIADATPERKFMRELTRRENATKIDAWMKNPHVGFYSIEYGWRRGEHAKRGDFSPDFFIKSGDQIFVVEIKDDGEIGDPSTENAKKHEFAFAHFSRLNEWLIKESVDTRYQFNMLTPRNFNSFFQKLREGTLKGFKSELDVVMATGVTS